MLISRKMECQAGNIPGYWFTLFTIGYPNNDIPETFEMLASTVRDVGSPNSIGFHEINHPMGEPIDWSAWLSI